MDNPHVPDDETLIRRALADPCTFEQLYLRYLDRVYAYVRTRANSEDEVADLMQQIFVEALGALPRYRGGNAAFAAWLFRIARNTVIDSYRRRRPTVSWDHVPDTAHPRTEESVESGVLQLEALTHLRAVVSTLSDDRQELLALRFGARLSVVEIAAVVGKSEAATQRQLHRIIQTLKELYHDRAR